jgi:hypothetical protein
MTQYYPHHIIRRINCADSYQDLLCVAIDILGEIRDKNPLKPIAMVCGPISTGGKGCRKDNLALFSRAIDRLTADGLILFNQMPFEEDMERIYKSRPELQGSRLLEEFYLPIFRLRFIKLLCFLPGWETSKGATWENEQAKKLKIPMIYLAESYMRD